VPTIIDSLIVTLGLDPSAYKSGSEQARADMKRTREDGRATAKELDAQGKRGAEFFGRLRGEAIALFAAFTGASGLKDFAQQILTGDAATGRLAKNIGVATGELSAWEGAATRAGGTAGDMDTAMRSLNSAFQSYMLDGTTGHDADFKGLGVTLEQLKSPTQTLLALADASSRIGRPEFVARLARIGVPEPVINLLARGRAGVAALVEEQRKLGVVTDADGEAAIRFQDSMAKLSSLIAGYARPVVSALADVFIRLSEHGPVLLGILAGLAAPLIALAAAAVAPFLPLVVLAVAVAGIGAVLGTTAEKIEHNERATRNWGEALKAVHQFLTGDFSGALETYRQNLRENTTAGGRPIHPILDGAASDALTSANIVRDPATGKYRNARPGETSPSGIKRNNPGNLRPVSGHGFNTYATAEDGADAMGRLLRGYQTRHGLNTIRGIVSRYAPSSENNTAAYIAAVTKRTGFGADQQIDTSNPATLAALQAAMIQQEQGRQPFSKGQILASASRVTRGAQRANAGAAPNGGGNSSSTSTATTSIGQITVYTAGTDGAGIARDLPGAIQKRGLTTQANTGIS
jgi:hypothetical protein